LYNIARFAYKNRRFLIYAAFYLCNKQFFLRKAKIIFLTF